jgi:hypothetical protein
MFHPDQSRLRQVIYLALVSASLAIVSTGDCSASEEAPLMPGPGPGTGLRKAGAGTVFEETVRLINISMSSRLSPESPYNASGPGRVHDFYHQIVRRSVFDTFPAFKGDEKLLEPALRQLGTIYSFINVPGVLRELDWVRGLRTKWLEKAIREVSPSLGPVNVEVPRELWIKSAAGVHPAFVTLDRKDLPALRAEHDTLLFRASSEGDLDHLITASLQASLEWPSEPSLRRMIFKGEPLDPSLFKRRLRQAVFLNLAVFHGNARALNSSLDRLADAYPEVKQVKAAILDELPKIRAERIRWLQIVALPMLYEAEKQHPQMLAQVQRSGQNPPVPHNPPGVVVPLPAIARIITEPEPDDVPKEELINSRLLLYEIEILDKSLFGRDSVSGRQAWPGVTSCLSTSLVGWAPSTFLSGYRWAMPTICERLPLVA